MNEILDDFEKEPQKNVSKTFSRLAFGCAMMSLGLFVYSMRGFDVYPEDVIINPFFYLVLNNVIFFFSLTAGTISSIFSHIRAEPMSVFKSVGALINFTFMGMLLFSVYFANFT